MAHVVTSRAFIHQQMPNRGSICIVAVFDSITQATKHRIFYLESIPEDDNSEDLCAIITAQRGSKFPFVAGEQVIAQIGEDCVVPVPPG